MGDLALVATPRRPPASLGAAIMTGLGGTLATAPRPLALVDGGAVARPERARVGATRTGSTWTARLDRVAADGRLLAAIAAVLVVSTLALGAWGLSTRTQLDRTAAEATRARDLADAEAGAMAVAMAVDHRAAALTPEALAPSARASVVYRPGLPEAYLVASGLPATPAGHVYQLWVADAAGVHGLATYHFDGNGPFIAPVGLDLAGRTAVMVTLEPEGGATGEPGPQVVFGTL